MPTLARLALLCALWVGIAGAQTFGPPGTPIDNFNRANEDPLSDGGDWTSNIVSTDPSTLIVLGNQLDRSAVAGNGSSWRNDATYGPDMEVSLALPDAVGGNIFIGVNFRLIDPGVAASTDGYAVWWNETTAGLLIRVLTNSTYATLSTTTVAVASGDSIGGSAVGDQICAWHKPAAGSWTLVDCETNTAHTGAGAVGAFTNTASYAGDDFWAATKVAASAQTIRSVIVTFGGVP